MPEGKTCPFYLIFYKEHNDLCTESQCQLWSEDMSMCSIALGMHGILSIADALRGISENIKNHFPE